MKQKNSSSFKSRPVETFEAYVLRQLADLTNIRSRKMFGALGVYYADLFFAIIDDQQVYFKTSPALLAQYKTWGMKPFQPNEKQIMKAYYQLPSFLIEDADLLCDWARKTIKCLEEAV